MSGLQRQQHNNFNPVVKNIFYSVFFFFLSAQFCKAQVLYLNFQTHTHGDTIDVNWITETETNMDYFILQRSFQGSISFTDLDTIPAFGNSTVYQYYSHVDIPPVVDTCYYYRLKDVTTSGLVGYSSVIPGCVFLPLTPVAGITEEKRPAIFPNPSNGVFEVDWGDRITEGALELFTAYGKMVFKTELSNQSKIKMQLEDLDSGFYFLKVGQGNGSYSGKVVLLNN